MADVCPAGWRVGIQYMYSMSAASCRSMVLDRLSPARTPSAATVADSSERASRSRLIGPRSGTRAQPDTREARRGWQLAPRSLERMLACDLAASAGRDGANSARDGSGQKPRIPGSSEGFGPGVFWPVMLGCATLVWLRIHPDPPTSRRGRPR
ncbi:hypothetical protein VTN02DRAFT_440 [Thermoascus thermophilus]